MLNFFVESSFLNIYVCTHRNWCRSSCKVPLILADFTWKWCIPQCLIKISNMKFDPISFCSVSSWYVKINGQSDMSKLIGNIMQLSITILLSLYWYFTWVYSVSPRKSQSSTSNYARLLPPTFSTIHYRLSITERRNIARDTDNILKQIIRKWKMSYQKPINTRNIGNVTNMADNKLIRSCLHSQE
jgi:hypothetical protein